MTTLNARANQAWRDYDPDADMSGSERLAFEEGWESGYNTAAREIAEAIEALDGPMTGENTTSAYLTLAVRIAREIGGAS